MRSIRNSSLVIRNLSDLDALVILGTDPEHSARRFPTFHDLGCHHSAAALRTRMRMGFALIAEAGARGFGNFFCHDGNPSLIY